MKMKPGANNAIRMAFLLAAGAACLGQDGGPYFSLSSHATFAPGEKASVSLSAWGVDQLEFRVYRVQDPVKFFEQLEDPHQFGGSAPRPAHERTFLERLRIWKRELRADIRRSLREQFTESPSQRLSALWPGKKSAPLKKGAQFAPAPVLNPQQLVATFQQRVSAHRRWDEQKVEVPVKDKGIYLVEAVRQNLRAYTVLMVSGAALITKTAQGRMIAIVTDRATGEPAAGAPVYLLARDKQLAEAKTNADGIAEIPLKGARPGSLRMVARRGDDWAVTTPEDYSFRNLEEQWMGYVYTDRPVYRPGHTVHFKAILRVRGAQGYQTPSGKSVPVEIHDADQNAVYQKNLTVSATGAIRDDFTLPAGAALGYYYVQVKAGEHFISGDFEVEEYKKPEYEVRVSAERPRILQGDSMRMTIDARYYFGEPVAGAQVHWTVSRSGYWFPLLRGEEDEESGMDSGDGGEGDEGGDGDNMQEGEARWTPKADSPFPCARSLPKTGRTITTPWRRG